MSCSSSSNPGIGGTGKFDLPVEIWAEVFAYLPIEDRKNIRLVSRRLYEVCNIFSRNEQIVFYGNPELDRFDDSAFFKSLFDGRRKVWNLKFYRFCLNNLPRSVRYFFKNARIESLVLENCSIPSGFFRMIVEFCENLHTLVLRREYDIGDEIMPTLQEVFNDLSQLQRRAIRPIHEKLTDFTFDYYLFDDFDLSLTNKKFLDFFKIFPNIKNLTIVLEVSKHEFNQFSTISSDINSVTEFTFSCIYFQLSEMRHQLEKLRLNLSNFSVENICRLSRIEMDNLNELDLNLYKIPRLDGQGRYNNLFEQFSHLTDLQCNIDEYHTNFSEFTLLILNNISQLRSLAISAHRRRAIFNFTEACFKALIRSQLSMLRLDCPYGLISPNFDYLSLVNDLVPNHSLKHLSLMLNEGQIHLVFATYCHYLESLSIRESEIESFESDTSDTSQTIWCICNNLKKLRKLIILDQDLEFPHIDHRLQTWLENIDQLYHPLDHLTHLFLMNNKCMDFAQSLLKYLVPNLISLIIGPNNLDLLIMEKKHSSIIWRNIQTLTKLEYLFIRYSMDLSFSRCLALCRNLPKLRYFILIGISSRPFNDSEFHKLFQINSSLRIVILSHSNGLFHVKFYKDMITNNVYVKNISYEDTWVTAYAFSLGFGIPTHYYNDRE